ncbi:dihydroorotase [Flavimarina sp. Hel_I_48]|uniref:dihydroorotase n=1 Tax=Flavimarina sp. Hel_I_48 TaxID=1392488 RepID=UPI0004DFA5B4|nr:dihydroorotase [Flavimarina sp. Hel_I_48]
MNIRINAAKLIAEGHDLNGREVSIRVENGTITAISEHLEPQEGETVIAEKGLKVSAGWFDSSVNLGEPGHEERETLANGLQVAARSGFTGIAVQPRTVPVIDTKASVQYLKDRAAHHAVELFPIGALTRGSSGEDLAELYDMHQGGAVAFGDYQGAVQNPNLLKLALQYVQGFDGLVLPFPQTKDLVGKGMVNEGVAATNLGLKGIPALAESLQIARDLHILEYTGGKMHTPTISTKTAVALIREAKNKGLDITCSVAVSHLIFTDEALNEFDTRYKLMPPLRTEEDRQALIDGINDGTIDMVCSDHDPIDIENKKLEFDHAMYGTIAQEVTFKALLNVVSEERAIHLLTAGRERFTGNNLMITEGKPANLTLFSTEGSCVYSKDAILAKSKNSAFIGERLQGTVYGVIANNQWIKA